jgi:hypothetical protein
MIPEHISAFQYVARTLDCWIDLREPNLLSDKYISSPGYLPKFQTITAKTANNPAFRFAGLVVNPLLCPEAFKPQTLSRAVMSWNKFTRHITFGNAYSCPEKGYDKGVLKYHGSPIHADYDLLSVVPADKDGKRIPTGYDTQATLFALVKERLNALLKKEMIQHGTEMMYQTGIGAAEKEDIFLFGPRGELRSNPSSMNLNYPH